ncbi:hypothetical protein FHR53_000569 [Xanthomonas arboricola]
MRAASNTYAEEVMHGFWKRRPGRRPRKTARARRWRLTPTDATDRASFRMLVRMDLVAKN